MGRCEENPFHLPVGLQPLHRGRHVLDKRRIDGVRARLGDGLVQGEANAVAGNKRMLSAMTPSIVLDSAGSLEMVVGTPGGPTIITSVTQVILNVLDQKMSLADAVAAPRIHHQALPDQTYYEHGGLSDATVRALQAMGHKMDERRGRSGIIAAIQKTAGGGVGVADPRYAGGALGY